MVSMTDKAVGEIKRIRESDAGKEGSVLRVTVVGGGCSGLSYQLDFDLKPPGPEDKVFEKNFIQVVIDPKSYLHVTGMELDFTDGLEGKGFVFTNPNATRTCGCGTSFSV